MQFAALGVLCLFPFLIVVSAGSGHDFRRTVVIRMGLDQHAAKDVNALISTGLHAVTGLSIFGGLVILLGAIELTGEQIADVMSRGPREDRWDRRRSGLK